MSRYGLHDHADGDSELLQTQRAAAVAFGLKTVWSKAHGAEFPGQLKGTTLDGAWLARVRGIYCETTGTGGCTARDVGLYSDGILNLARREHCTLDPLPCHTHIPATAATARCYHRLRLVPLSPSPPATEDHPVRPTITTTASDSHIVVSFSGADLGMVGGGPLPPVAGQRVVEDFVPSSGNLQANNVRDTATRHDSAGVLFRIAFDL